MTHATIKSKRGKRTSDNRQLASDLLYADTEQAVIDILTEAGYWDDDDAWREYGDNENNYSIIGNQQSAPEAALVERLVNSVDACLMRKHQLHGTGKTPQSIQEAVQMYYGDTADVSDWSQEKRFAVAHDIQIVATGHTPRKGNPCFTIVDQGEGIKPDDFPDTIMSLAASNKLRIPYVQGKFNMGGSGSLKFCGDHNLQLIISRRDPDLLEKGARGRERDWGFTIVRREDPSEGKRSSTYTYLAPEGEVLSFRAKKFGIMPEQGDAYAEQKEHGTLVKLYEYKTSFKQQIPRSRSILEAIDLMVPKLALPIRVYDARTKYWEGDYDRDRTRDLARTVTGIQCRLQDDIDSKRRDNVEFSFTSDIKIDGQLLKATVYAFKKGKAKSYRRKEGIVFTVNGQTHGTMSDYFFRRKAVGMSYLVDSLLVVVDCSHIDGRHREDLFLNSRDRLAEGEFRNEIEAELESLVGDNDELKKLREKRRREHNRKKLAESKPLESMVRSIIEQDPNLTKLFRLGNRIELPKDAELPEEGDDSDIALSEYTGRKFPTYFRFNGLVQGESIRRKLKRDSFTRCKLETDAANDYFRRDDDPGEFFLTMVNLDNSSNEVAVDEYTFTLQDGEATLTIPTPENVDVGDEVVFNIHITDPHRQEKNMNPFVNQINASIQEAQEPPKTPSGDKKKPENPGINLPEIREVYQRPDDNDWGWEDMDPEFDKYTALRIVHGGRSGEGAEVYDFYVNMDNVHLKGEMIQNRDEADVVRQRYTYALVLLGMSIIRDDQEHPVSDHMDEELLSVEQKVEMLTRAAAPVVLPMIDKLSTISAEEWTV